MLGIRKNELHDGNIGRWIAALILMSVLALFSFCAFAEEGTIFAVVNNPNSRERLNLRTRPDVNAPTLGKYYNGVPLQILEYVSDKWIKVQIGNLEGYTMSEYTSFDVDAVGTAMPTYLSRSSAWEVYSSQSLNSDFMMHGYNETVILLGFTSEWWHIKVGDDIGFVPYGCPCLVQTSGCFTDGYFTAVVNNPDKSQRLNLREAASRQSPSLGKYYNGCLVAILERQDNGWSKVRIGTIDGYMLSQFLDNNLPADVQLPKASLEDPNEKGVTIHSLAQTTSFALGIYPNGTNVSVLGVTETWCHVEINGTIGFVLKKHLDPEPVYRYVSDQSDYYETNSSLTGNNNAWNGPTGQHPVAEWDIVVNDYTAIVNNPVPSDRLHLRSAPDSSSVSLGKYYNGVRVVINGDCSGEWTSVCIGNTLHGYMKTEYLMINGTNVESAMPIMYVDNPSPSQKLNLREKQSISSKSLGLYPNGTKVVLMGFCGEWAHVIVDGQFGFMQSKYLK